MPKFNQETAIIAMELQRLLADFAYDLDFNDCRGIADLYTEDGEFGVGDYTHKGRPAIRKFYEDRNERVRTQLKDGIRVGAHTFLNLRFAVEDQNNASVTFTNVSYAGEGHPPVRGTVSPAMITACRMVFRHEPDGNWRITSFNGKPLFIGDDPFTRASLLKS
jgi:hypothetical protein